MGAGLQADVAPVPGHQQKQHCSSSQCIAGGISGHPHRLPVCQSQCHQPIPGTHCRHVTCLLQASAALPHVCSSLAGLCWIVFPPPHSSPATPALPCYSALLAEQGVPAWDHNASDMEVRWSATHALCYCGNLILPCSQPQ